MSLGNKIRHKGSEKFTRDREVATLKDPDWRTDRVCVDIEVVTLDKHPNLRTFLPHFQLEAVQ